MKRLKTYVACLLCIMMLVFGLVACQSRSGGSTLACPLPQLSWGMTCDEAISALESAGIDEASLNVTEISNGYWQISVTFAQCEQLGVTDIGGSPLRDNGETSKPIVLSFIPDQDGEAYLATAYVIVSAETEDEVAENLTSVYGTPAESTGQINGSSKEIYFWTSANDKDIEEIISSEPYVSFFGGVMESENGNFTLSYSAEGYVRANYGNF